MSVKVIIILPTAGKMKQKLKLIIFARQRIWRNRERQNKTNAGWRGNKNLIMEEGKSERMEIKYIKRKRRGEKRTIEKALGI